MSTRRRCSAWCSKRARACRAEAPPSSEPFVCESCCGLARVQSGVAAIQRVARFSLVAKSGLLQKPVHEISCLVYETLRSLLGRCSSLGAQTDHCTALYAGPVCSSCSQIAYKVVHAS